MFIPYQRSFDRYALAIERGINDVRSYAQCIVPVIAGAVLLGGSFLPWILGPLGEGYSAWNLPLDLGWQLHTNLVNYGVLCLCCALYAFVVAYVHWKLSNVHARSDLPAWQTSFIGKYRIAGILCLLPLALFLLQYLFIDLGELARWSQDKTQALLIQQHFEYALATPYGVAPQRLPFRPFFVDSSTVLSRFELLLNQVSIGLLFPCLSALLLLVRSWARQSALLGESLRPMPLRKHQGRLWLIGSLLLVVILGRAPVGMLCQYQAKSALATGSYTSALGWLDAAGVLNPDLDQAPFYHIERGQALYFSHPDQPSDESRAYLASVYRDQGNYLGAYQELQAVWLVHRSTPWVSNQMSTTLEHLVEYNIPLSSLPAQGRRSVNDALALPWLQTLVQVDPTSIYGHYILGRVYYDLHNYTACTAQMSVVVHLSRDRDVQSSAYTYAALSAAGQGKYAAARTLLFAALALDPYYHNNTAREALSGLH